MTDFQIGDKVAAAVSDWRKKAQLRVGVVEKIYGPTAVEASDRLVIRDEHGDIHIVRAARAVHVDRDKYHTFDELYYYRALYNAHAALYWDDMGYRPVKSRKHSDGEEWEGLFIVSVQLPTGQVTNHYHDDVWDLFQIPEAEFAPEWDGHGPAEAADRLARFARAARDIPQIRAVAQDYYADGYGHGYTDGFADAGGDLA